MNASHVQPKVKISSKGFRAGQFIQVQVSRGQNSNIRAVVSRRSEALHFFRLDGSKNLGLSQRAHVPDLIEEHGTAVGGHQLALIRQVGAGKSAPLVTEQLAFQQRIGDRGAVDGDQGMGSADAILMNQLRHQFLASPGFPRDQDIAVGCGHAPNVGSQRLHRRARTY